MIDKVIDRFITCSMGGELIGKDCALHYRSIFWVDENDNIFFELKYGNNGDQFIASVDIWDGLQSFFELSIDQTNFYLSKWVFFHLKYITPATEVHCGILLLRDFKRWEGIKEDFKFFPK